MSLAANIKALRFEKGLGPAGLAAAAGISVSALYQIEGGRSTRPTARVLSKLAAALGVKVADLNAPPAATIYDGPPAYREFLALDRSQEVSDDARDPRQDPGDVAPDAA
jgi:transcriptional regulator with XRE-family HTH domain